MLCSFPFFFQFLHVFIISYVLDHVCTTSHGTFLNLCIALLMVAIAFWFPFVPCTTFFFFLFTYFTFFFSFLKKGGTWYKVYSLPLIKPYSICTTYAKKGGTKVVHFQNSHIINHIYLKIFFNSSKPSDVFTVNSFSTNLNFVPLHP